VVVPFAVFPEQERVSREGISRLGSRVWEAAGAKLAYNPQQMSPNEPTADSLGTRVEQRWNMVRFQLAQARSFVGALVGDKLRPDPGPQLDGVARVDGVHDAIEIVRDANGVPHVFATNSDDAIFGLGFVHGQDRGWQLEFYRRVVSGRLAEAVGPQGLPTDRLMRHLGLRRAGVEAWAKMAPKIQMGFLPYMDGINAAFDQTPRSLEFRVLDFEPEPWQGEDSVCWAKMLSFMLAPAWEMQVVRARVLEEVGLEALSAVDPGYPAAGPVIAPPGAPYAALADSIAEARASQAGTFLGTPGLGSNNWAVAPAHTANGRALLAVDPHLTPIFPANGYFVHLDCPDFTAAGATLPGLPGIIWGFNRRIAWGPTAGLASLQDVVVEEFEEGSNRYRIQDGWAEAEIVPETIKVRGQRSEEVQVRITRHGPIVSPELPGIQRALALRSSILLPTTAGSGLLGLFSAANIDEFREAIAGFHDFNLTFAYADVDGHIGIQTSGDVPARSPGEAWLPQAGWLLDPLDEDALVPFSELPHTFDPEDGLVWSANNAPAPAAELPFDGEFLDEFRASRIGAMLRVEPAHSPDTARVMQGDRTSIPLLRLREHMVSIEALPGRETELLAAVAAWDGVMDLGSMPAAVAASTFARLLDAVIHGKLGHAAKLFGGDAHAIPNLNMMTARGASLVLRCLDETPVDWFTPAGTEGSGPAIWQAVLTQAFRDGVALLEDRLGKDPACWGWGRCHPLTLRHGLHDAPPMARLFDVGPIAFGGDGNTVFQAGPVSGDPFAPVTAIPALRLIVDLSDPPSAEFILAGGQSERRGNVHHHDLLDDWANGKTRPLATDPVQVRAAAAHTLRLEPDLA